MLAEAGREHQALRQAGRNGDARLHPPWPVRAHLHIWHDMPYLQNFLSPLGTAGRDSHGPVPPSTHDCTPVLPPTLILLFQNKTKPSFPCPPPPPHTHTLYSLAMSSSASHVQCMYDRCFHLT